MARRIIEGMHDEHVNVTPLIDIVMCLIIFFLVAGKLAKEEASEGISVPQAGQSRELADQQNRIIVNVKFRNPKVGIAEGTIIEIRKREIMPGQLATEFRAEVARLGSEFKSLRVIVRGEEKLPYEYVAPVLIACAQANLNNVYFATRNYGG